MSSLSDHLPPARPRSMRGADNPNAKLTPEIVAEIIETRRETGASAARIAAAVEAKHGIAISVPAIAGILRGRSWGGTENLTRNQRTPKPPLTLPVPLVGIDVETTDTEATEVAR